MHFNPDQEQPSETLLACEGAAVGLLGGGEDMERAEGRFFDICLSQRLLALDLAWPNRHYPGTLISRFTSPCSLETPALFADAHYPTCLEDGSAVLMLKFYPSDEHPEGIPNILVYEVGGGSYEPFPPDRGRDVVHFEARNDPVYYIAGAGADGERTGIYRFYLEGSTRGRDNREELVYEFGLGGRTLERRFTQDSLVMLVGMKADTQWFEIRQVVNLNSLEMSQDTVLVTSERPEWDPPPSHHFWYQAAGSYLVLYWSTSRIDTLARFSLPLLLGSNYSDETHLRFVDCDSSACRYIRISGTAVKVCDTLWTCGPELPELMEAAERTGRGDTVLMALQDLDTPPGPFDSLETRVVLTQYTPDCRLDTLIVIEDAFDPSLGYFGGQMVATQMVVAANGVDEVPNIIIYDLDTRELHRPLPPDRRRWSPVQRVKGEPVYYLSRDGSTEVYRYSPELGEEKVTDLAPTDSMTEFTVYSDGLTFSYVDRTTQDPVGEFKQTRFK